MRRWREICIPGIVVGALLATSLFCLLEIADLGSSPGPTENINYNPADTKEDYCGWLSFNCWWLLIRSFEPMTFYTAIIALLTGALVMVGYLQIRQTRVLQRAYLAVDSQGVSPF